MNLEHCSSMVDLIDIDFDPSHSLYLKLRSIKTRTSGFMLRRVQYAVLTQSAGCLFKIFIGRLGLCLLEILGSYRELFCLGNHHDCVDVSSFPDGILQLNVRFDLLKKGFCLCFRHTALVVAHFASWQRFAALSFGSFKSQGVVCFQLGWCSITHPPCINNAS